MASEKVFLQIMEIVNKEDPAGLLIGRDVKRDPEYEDEVQMIVDWGKNVQSVDELSKLISKIFNQMLGAHAGPEDCYHRIAQEIFKQGLHKELLAKNAVE